MTVSRTGSSRQMARGRRDDEFDRSKESRSPFDAVNLVFIAVEEAGAPASR